MELRHLRYFVVVAEELHFGRAAERLNICQPPLSVQIKNLEDELEVQLFDRSRRQVNLTRCGEVFLRRAQTVLTEIENAAEEVRAIDRGDLDSITIGYKSAIMLGEINALLKKFRLSYPFVQLKFVQASVTDQYQAVHDHRLDIGFIDAPVTEHSSDAITENVKGYPVTKERLLLAVPNFHPLCHRKIVRLSEFANDQFIFLNRQVVPSMYDQQLGLCQEAGFSPNILFHTEQLPEILAFVAAGYGVGFCPESAVNVWSDSIVYLSLKEHSHVTISMIFRNDHESKAVQYFRDLLPGHSWE